MQSGIALLRQPVHLLALGFGVGLVPVAPGTAATAAAGLAGWWLMPLPLSARAALVAALALAGIWICGESSRRLRKRDHPAVVWDEIVGFLAVTLALPAQPLWWAAAFVLFRLFDIAKPWPVGYLDRRVGGGMGIMLDDLAAAGLAVVCILLGRLALA